MHHSSFSITLIILLSLISFYGCDNDPMRNGAQAVYLGNLPKAEKAFRTALEADSSNIEAKRRLADVELLRKNFGEAEKILNEISVTLPVQDRNTTLTIDQKVTRNLLTQQYTLLYVSWIDSVDQSTNPDLFRHIFTEGIKYAPADATLNSAAVNYYVAIGDQYVNEGKDLLAIENYRSALGFSMPSDTKNEIMGKISKSRRTNFDKAFARQLERSKEELQPPYQWNEEQQAIEITIDYPLTGRRYKDIAPETIKVEATPMIESSIRKLIGTISTLPAQIDISELFVPKYKIDSIDIKRRHASLVVLVSPIELASSTFLSIAKYDKTADPSTITSETTPPQELPPQND